jgi:hypothetical protein
VEQGKHGKELRPGPPWSLHRPAVEAGLSRLDAGGDFADGIIAYEGDWLGGEEFVVFRLLRLSRYCSPEAVAPACFSKN